MDGTLVGPPVLGDAATGIVSVYIVSRARDCGAGKAFVARMLGNVLLDTVVGSIPILGSISTCILRQTTA
ncbi:DUF4112 domain-containing protein [Mesorhizobium neociceri]|uniref:DUF4112 domain-containing protein n=1 Tax=Mesorhizobium neociceri TaxID=1307853 RepID=A0A838BGW1_9HYPH|nr:DUF4112 domain-containing protein [Mesorhizobium neociceri]